LPPIVSAKSPPLSGRISIPGDKSISHRALILGAMAIGKTRVFGLLESEDVFATASALRAMGISILQNAPEEWHVIGRGVGGLLEPNNVLNLGNSGTGVRLLMGAVGGHPFVATFTGDASLISRPMDRIIAPLSEMGIHFTTRTDGKLPITVSGPATLLPIEYKLPISSAQVKSAILLAGLQAPGNTSVIESEPTRDHTELMLREFGAKITIEDHKDGSRKITVIGQPELRAQDINVPGDISSAAFPLVAALIIPNSKLTITNIGINPLRSGLIESLRDMGSSIELINIRDNNGNKTADLVATARPMRGIDVPAKRAPSMIDEYPILAIAAAYACGTTTMTGLSELRVKESDRIDSMTKGLINCGIKVNQTKDTLTIHGNGNNPKGGAVIAANLDHRIAMAFLVCGMGSNDPITIDDASPIETSFPRFRQLMNSLGGKIELL